MKNSVLALLLLAYSFSSLAQKPITLEDIYHKGAFRTKTVRNINWMKDGRYYTAQRGGNILQYDITTGNSVDTLLQGASLRAGSRFDAYQLSADERKILLMTERETIYRRSYRGEYYIYDLDTRKVRQLSTQGKQSYATFSPDGRKIAFVRDNNLFYTSLEEGKEVQVTHDGRLNHIINGSTDWVYEEEFGFVKAFFWSPDSKKLAFYRFDESQVKEYSMQKWNRGQLYPEDYRFKYPKAGERNSTVQVYIHHLSGGKTVQVGIGEETDIYLPRIKWTQDPDLLSLRKMNRLQNELEILHANAGSGQTKTVLKEKSDTYIDAQFCDDLTYLKDGRHFIHSSEKDGYKHLYLYTLEGKQVRQITQGKWEVDGFLGIDESKKRKIVYYTSAEASPMERHFYRIDLNGKNKQKLSKDKGSHHIDMSNGFHYYIDHFSNTSTPDQFNLYRTKDNAMIKSLENNARLKTLISTYGLQPKSFFTFSTTDGTVLNGYTIKPKAIAPDKKYPVLIYQYSGPGSQQVKNEWAGRHFYWHQMLAQKGYIIAVVDSRGTGGRGAGFKKMTYKHLGKLEIKDHISAARHLASLPETDPDRIGIWGWSYGGYISSLAMMKGDGIFKAGIAIAPVTNWRFYDTIYTERYLQRPQDNASGYDDNSPTTHAHLLQGNFLLVHGTGDDNVHVQNSMALTQGLIDAGKQFETFFYPDKAHSIRGRNTRIHLYTKMTKFLIDNL